ncbi:putative sulfate exporter family transporter, partial [Escherichia coli]|uniref:putative sulfate exporter family transporter n=1 Tax=Escherichia coli TaxID=562 RepID=UPI003EE35104
DNNGCNSHGYFTGFRFHYRLSRQYRGSTTDTATGTDQPAGVLFAKQYLLRLGIILYGFRLTFSQIADVGISGIIIDVLTLS